MHSKICFIYKHTGMFYSIILLHVSILLVITSVKAESLGSEISPSELLLEFRKTIKCKKKKVYLTYLHTYKMC